MSSDQSLSKWVLVFVTLEKESGRGRVGLKANVAVVTCQTAQMSVLQQKRKSWWYMLTGGRAAGCAFVPVFV